MKNVDITLLTEERYLNPKERNPYVNNILLEDEILTKALEDRGLLVHRENWANPSQDWSTSQYLMFRTTWDYFDRFDEFAFWLNRISELTSTINDIETIEWNLDKQYLLELDQKGIRIPETMLIKSGTERSLRSLFEESGWEKAVLKPCISASARHTYVIEESNIEEYEKLFKKLIHKENYLLQEFQNNVLTKGELSVMFFGDTYTHTILKQAKPGDFRVQDDFGGTVQLYETDKKVIEFSEKVIAAMDEPPIYSRIDLLWDNNNELILSELELIEPELWFRYKPQAAEVLADLIVERYFD